MCIRDRAEENKDLKKEEQREKIKRSSLMEQINKAKSISIWIFIVPFVAINACLIVTTQFHSIIESQQYRLPNMFPYLDGQACVFYRKDQFGYKVLGGGWIKE